MVSELDETSQPSSMARYSKGTPITFKHVLSVKLNNKNHLHWKQQVLAAIRGHNLTQFLETSPKPPKLLSSQDEIAGIINTEYLEWEQQVLPLYLGFFRP